MKYSKLIEYIDKFVEVIKTFFPDLKINHSRADEYMVKDRWEGKAPAWFNENGLYYYLSNTEEVIYIGKADHQSGKGIGNRSTNKEKIEFIKENRVFIIKLTAHGQENPRLQKELLDGDFFIAGSVVNPSYLSCLLEVFALSICMKMEGDIPYFNNKIC